jgi:NMD protein affecting ribosome stability and mRNA decay
MIKATARPQMTLVRDTSICVRCGILRNVSHTVRRTQKSTGMCQDCYLVDRHCFDEVTA